MEATFPSSPVIIHCTISRFILWLLNRTCLCMSAAYATENCTSSIRSCVTHGQQPITGTILHCLICVWTTLVIYVQNEADIGICGVKICICMCFLLNERKLPFTVSCDVKLDILYVYPLISEMMYLWCLASGRSVSDWLMSRPDVSSEQSFAFLFL